MSTAPIITDLQKINPSAIIELFTLTTDATLHGSAQTYRFHNGTSLNANGDIIWAGNQYLKMPIEAEGFAFRKGQLPRPTLTVSNALGTITAILLNVNSKPNRVFITKVYNQNLEILKLFDQLVRSIKISSRSGW